MKFCAECGYQMTDEMLFCPQCGTKTVSSESEQPILQTTLQPQQTYSVQSTHKSDSGSLEKKRKIRTGMKIGMIVCFVFAGIYSLLSLAEPFMLSMTFFFLILGIMFLLLGITPKESPYMFGKKKGLKKGLFVLISLILAFVIVGVLMGILPQQEAEDSIADNSITQSESDDTGVSRTEKTDDKQGEKKHTLADVEKWYNGQIPAVSQSLMQFAESVEGLSNLNVDSSKFRFGEDLGWYDCHYTFYFTCKVDGVSHKGEARAFVKYQESTINWFHFEIFSNSGSQSVVEHYDDSYDEIIEEYYKELQNRYK